MLTRNRVKPVALLFVDDASVNKIGNSKTALKGLLFLFLLQDQSL